MTLKQKLCRIFKRTKEDDFKLSDKEFLEIMKILQTYKNFSMISKHIPKYLESIDLSGVKKSDFNHYYSGIKKYFFMLRNIRDYLDM